MECSDRDFGAESDDQGEDGGVSTDLQQKLNQQYYKSLDGFLMVVAKNGDIIYVSENVEKHLGLTQVEMNLTKNVYRMFGQPLPCHD